MDVRDWSTRKLKRKYFTQYRKVWGYQAANFSVTEDLAMLRSLKEELIHRGWHV